MSLLLFENIRADLDECRATLRDGSKSFHAASRILPREIADSAVALYAFCRVADDAIDNAGGTITAYNVSRYVQHPKYHYLS